MLIFKQQWIGSSRQTHTLVKSPSKCFLPQLKGERWKYPFPGVCVCACVRVYCPVLVCVPSFYELSKWLARRWKTLCFCRDSKRPWSTSIFHSVYRGKSASVVDLFIVWDLLHNDGELFEMVNSISSLPFNCFLSDVKKCLHCAV